jgi:hypothetical protein
VEAGDEASLGEQGAVEGDAERAAELACGVEDAGGKPGLFGG